MKKTMGWNLEDLNSNVTTEDRSLSFWLDRFSADNARNTLADRIYWILRMSQFIYYPILAVIGVPANIVAMVILLQGKCGLSKCITHYLVAMSASDLLVVILNLVLRHIPIVYSEYFSFVKSIRVCNIHAVLLYAATDCSVWFTIVFTFDRFVAICCQKLKRTYCVEKRAAIVLGIVTVLSCSKNISWYFMYTDMYGLQNRPWFCVLSFDVGKSYMWGAIEFAHHILTAAVPFIVILLLNIVTVRHILVSSRVRWSLLAQSTRVISRDPKMARRRKSIILLFAISANFILSWSVFLVYSIWRRMWLLDYRSLWIDRSAREVGFMLQLLSCCTNTCIYAATQTKFREQLKHMFKYPFTIICQISHR
ncbi:probable G-protein coupled receptor 139 [Stegostoma tigrinum]|uniref:probable G-protein coupled receptor 139 n=1 Tax=Stegostoma tigrinum TaxID=3053191 RepID=UPI0028708016|nr:probable G-protein coupled receptor 139 [Stegostoma tigrinum]